MPGSPEKQPFNSIGEWFADKQAGETNQNGQNTADEAVMVCLSGIR